MKKLIVAVMAVGMAVAANAAAVVWQETKSSIYNGKGTGTGVSSKLAEDTVVYLIQYSAHSADDMISALYSAGSASAFASTLSSWADQTGSLNSGAKFDESGTSSKFTAGSNEKAYFAIIDGDKLFVSDVLDTEYASVGGNDSYYFTWGSQSTASKTLPLDAAEGYADGGWYTVSVPEPTSGLLLLLGMAGLALRRRRA